MHPILSRSEDITFLLQRKFPLFGLTRASPGIVVPRPLAGPRYTNDTVATFRAELEALTDSELHERVAAERDTIALGKRVRADAEERARFFHQPDAAADYDHWSKAAHWTLDEAIALSLGKAPEVVTWERVNPLVHVSPFAKQFERLRDLARRAAQWGQLFHPVLPGIFLGWAKRNDIPYPKELEEKVVARGNHIVDWKAAYDQLAKATDTRDKGHAAELMKAVDAVNELKSQRDGLRAERDEVSERLRCHGADLDIQKANNLALEVELAEQRKTAAALRDQLDTRPEPEKPLHPSVKRSFQKMILGMAMDKFNFRPRGQKTAATTNIANALQRQGIKLDVDTVRARLQEAAEEIEFETENMDTKPKSV